MNAVIAWVQSKLSDERGQFNVGNGVGIIVIVLVILIFLIVAGFVNFNH